MNNTERKGCAAVSWLKNAKSTRKPYEDRYRLLTKDIPLVGKSGRGELFAVLDGIGGAPRGMAAALRQLQIVYSISTANRLKYLLTAQA